jgi:hypothetical protein
MDSESCCVVDLEQWTGLQRAATCCRDANLRGGDMQGTVTLPAYQLARTSTPFVS